MISAYSSQHPHSWLSQGITPTASHQHIAPEPPGQREEKVEGESGQELFSPMHVTSQCNFWDGPPVCCLCIYNSTVRNSPYSPLLSTPLLVFCPPVFSLCSYQAEIQTHGKCKWAVFPWELALYVNLYPTHQNHLALAGYPLAEAQGPGERKLSGGNTPAPHCADTSSMLAVTSPWVISMECAWSSSAETPPSDGVEEVF